MNSMTADKRPNSRAAGSQETVISSTETIITGTETLISGIDTNAACRSIDRI